MASKNENHKERFGHLCNNEEFADIFFILKEGEKQQRIPAHKLVLSVGSDVFKTMFFGSLTTESNEIKIPDVEPAAFLALLKFLYSNEVIINSETVMSTLYTAKKYNVVELERHCVNFLKNNLTAQNAFFLLSQARFYEESELATMCLDVIDKNTMVALDSGFTDIDLDTLIAVLERDTLQIFESKLFNTILLWSKAECNRKELPATPNNLRSVLGLALTLIKFSNMTFKRFVNGPVQSGLLTDFEIKKCCINIASKTNSTEIPRCCTHLANPTEKHLKFYYTMENIEKQALEDQFKFTRPVVIVGFALYTYIVEDNSNVTITFKEKKNTLFQSNRFNYLSTASLDLLFIVDKPIMIYPNNIYTINTKIGRLSDFELNPRNPIQSTSFHRAPPIVKQRCDSQLRKYPTIPMQSTFFHLAPPPPRLQPFEKVESLKPLNMNSINSYISFENCSGIISRIIFYDSK